MAVVLNVSLATTAWLGSLFNDSRSKSGVLELVLKIQLCSAEKMPTHDTSSYPYKQYIRYVVYNMHIDTVLDIMRGRHISRQRQQEENIFGTYMLVYGSSDTSWRYPPLFFSVGKKRTHRDKISGICLSILSLSFLITMTWS